MMPDFHAFGDGSYAVSIELLLFIVWLAVAIAGPLALLVARDKLIQRAWQLSASRLELSFAPGPLIGGDAMEGEVGGYRIRVVSELRRTTRVSLDARRIIPPTIALSLKAWGFIRADGSLMTGDEDFDRTIFATGQAQELLARLNSDTRTILRDAITSPPGRFTAQIEIGHGFIVYTAPGVVAKMRNLVCIIFTLVRLANALRLEGTVQAALRDNVCSPLEPTTVRLKNLRALIEMFPFSREAAEASRFALRSSSWSLRLAGAKHLDQTLEGLDMLLSILRSSDAPPRARIRALRHLLGLAGRLPSDSDVIAASKAPAAELRIAAAEVLGLRRSEAALERLLEMTRDPRHEVVERVIDNLAGIADLRIEPALIALLAHDMIEVRRAAARGLESVGTVQAVEPLLASIRGVLTDIELKAIARRAIARIQGRLVGADAGHLSIIEQSSCGALSLSPAEGALSIEPK